MMTRKGFDPEFHKQVLVKILVDVFKKFNGKLGFKGGTCAYLFYELPRISLDLDFDILGDFTKENIDELKVILEKYGEIKDSREKRFTDFFLLSYKKDAPNIKVELNRRIWKNNRYKNIWFLGVEMKIVDEATLLTNKIVALSERRFSVARDTFDVYYLLTLNYTLNGNLIKERTGKDVNEYLRFLIPFIKKTYTSKNILQGIGEVLEKKQKEWVKKELIVRVIEEIEKRFDSQ